jgi:hypothetical protein
MSDTTGCPPLLPMPHRTCCWFVWCPCKLLNVPLWPLVVTSKPLSNQPSTRPHHQHPQPVLPAALELI